MPAGGAPAGARARHARGQAEHARLHLHRPARLEVRPRRSTTRARPSSALRGSDRLELRGPAHAHRLADLRARARSARRSRRSPASATSRSTTSAAASASPTPPRTSRRRSRPTSRPRSRAVRELLGAGKRLVIEPGPRAGRQRRRDPLHRGVGQARRLHLRRRRRRHVRQPAARCSTARSTRRRSPTASAPGGELCHVAGKHCESSDVIVRDVHLHDPRARRRARHARRPAPTGTRWPTTTTACRARP